MATRLLLHVEDDRDEAFLLQRALQKSGLDWQLHHAGDGEAAVDYLTKVRAGQAPRPDLLVLDVKMPRMSGLEVLEWAARNVPNMPAVMLTSSGLLADRLRARDLGSLGYFEKSATFVELIEFLRHWDQHTLAPRTGAQ